MVAVGSSAIDSNCDRHSSRHIDLPDPVPLLPWPSSNRRYLLSDHIRFHHTHYAKGHLVSSAYRGNDGNNTPYFLIPTILVAGGMYLVLPLNLFVVTITASVVSFSAHVYLDKQYHAEGSRLTRFAWFRRKQQFQFIHHLHTDSNFAVIDFFWDRVLGTYRSPNRNPR
jgi:sterol desaturase/sphingolipid hydroxylase (fatty acid hydroxylase superfamily)